MKKILYILILCSLFISCDKTENQAEIKNLFIGLADDELVYSDYEKIEKQENAYLENFDNAQSSTWEERNDNYGNGYFENGLLVLSGKKDFYTWKQFAINSSNDFQLECYLKCSSASTAQGLVFGVNSNSDSNNFFCVGSGSTTVTIGHYDGTTSTKWYAGKDDVDLNEFHLFTIRKIGNKMSFFLDKKYLAITGYSNFDNYGFVVQKNQTIEVDYVQIDYIREIE